MAVPEGIIVRRCERKSEEVNYLLELTDKSGWDFSMYDIDVYFRLDPDFLFVAADKAGTPVGFAGISQQAPGVFYFSNFIVREDLRGKGVGRLLWKASIDRAGDGNIVLDGASQMVSWYKTHGFPYQTRKVLFYNVVLKEEMKNETNRKYEVVDLADYMWPELMQYDKLIYPDFDRENILRAAFTRIDLVRVIVAKDAGSIVGYGSIHKKPREEYGLRNVVADNEYVLQAILQEMFRELPVGTKVHFMLLDGKPLPQYLKHSVKGPETAARLHSKQEIRANSERMWLPTAHII